MNAITPSVNFKGIHCKVFYKTFLMPKYNQIDCKTNGLKSTSLANNKDKYVILILYFRSTLYGYIYINNFNGHKFKINKIFSIYKMISHRSLSTIQHIWITK